MTGQQRTEDRWLLLPRYWIRLHHETTEQLLHPHDAPSLVDGLLSEMLGQIDTGFQDIWTDEVQPDGSIKECENLRMSLGYQWRGYTLFAPLDRQAHDEIGKSLTTGMRSSLEC